MQHQTVHSRGDAGEELSTNDSNSAEYRSLKVSFRLMEPYARQLEQSAADAQMTYHQFARQLLVAALEDPSSAMLLTGIADLGSETASVRAEMRSLSREVTSLKVSIAATLEFLLLSVGELTQEEAKEVLKDLFDV